MVVSKLIQVIFLYVVVRVWNERALLMTTHQFIHYAVNILIQFLIVLIIEQPRNIITHII